MPKVTFDPKHRATSKFDYPKISLEKGEAALILMIDSEPTMEYVHTLRRPVLVNGKPVMEEVEAFGKKRTQMKTDFVGRHICLGDVNTIMDKGKDARSCPVCRASDETDAVSAPERRFAVHVIRYKTQPGTFQVQEPFQVDLVAWAFGDRVFNQIVDFAAEWGDLRKHDLKLGPCTSKQFQKFDIQVAATAQWLASKDRQSLVAEVYKNNQAADLSALIARRIGRELVEEDLDKVLSAHRQAHGRGAASEEEDVMPSTSEMSLDDLLTDGPNEAVSTVETPTVPEVADETPEPVTETTEAEEQKKSAPAASNADGPELDLEAMLADL